jgi:hypothetical protein
MNNGNVARVSRLWAAQARGVLAVPFSRLVRGRTGLTGAAGEADRVSPFNHLHGIGTIKFDPRTAYIYIVYIHDSNVMNRSSPRYTKLTRPPGHLYTGHHPLQMRH